MRVTFSEPFLLAVFLTCLLRDARWMGLLWMAAALHEAGHWIALRLLGAGVSALRFRLSGLEMVYPGRQLSYRAEACAALAGPGANLLCAGVLAAVGRTHPFPGLELFLGCHLALAAFNLLPALPLDGGRAMSALLCGAFPQRGERAALWISGAVGLALRAAGMRLLLTARNPTLFAAGGLIFGQVLQKMLYRDAKTG